ncbi:hypothetical protein [Natronospora cellulosivora (SeqCode)]
MKIGIIRHFKVVDSSKFLMTSNEFKEWIKKYDEFDIKHNTICNFNPKEWGVCYTSTLSRAYKTADNIYKGKIIKTDLLNEVAIAPFTKNNIILTNHLWLSIGRVLFKLYIFEY